MKRHWENANLTYFIKLSCLVFLAFNFTSVCQSAFAQETTTQEDLIAPKILAPSLTLTTHTSVPNLMADVIVMDDHDSETELRILSSDLVEGMELDETDQGIKYVTYQAVDAAGNETIFIRPIYVYGYQEQADGEDISSIDITPPEVTCYPVYLKVGSQSVAEFEDKKASASATDNNIEDLTPNLQLESSAKAKLDLDKPGNYLVTWEVEDRAGNKGLANQWVIVMPQ
ncbi:immunoglobulin-like domain-containing protein [Vaginisenegalia massiliensis]|uniref:immunoglobulin-like domain-containing protein n=1 Tax=Vaginisenegalia massiliensis TaxID=2058294 RepID=UPI000F543DEB|nr:immunoglobulin-like domain-containing protein [Vaginisenegalia massiliensis]